MTGHTADGHTDEEGDAELHTLAVVVDNSEGSAASPYDEHNHPGGTPQVKGEQALERLADNTFEGLTEDGVSTAGSGDEDTEDYEGRRQQRILGNQLLLSTLGIQSSASFSSISQAGPSQPSQSSSHRRKPRKSMTAREPVFDRAGHVISLPPPGQTQKMACVEMPSDRRIRRMIADGEYRIRSDWSAGEERRWRFGRGRGKLEPGEEQVVGGVGEDFRWRRWRGLRKELKLEMKMRGELEKRDKQPESQPQGPAATDPSHYSMLTGPACHQCRRKSDKLKMRCRNVNPHCAASFCETCCKRYSYFDFDPDSRSFICPLCRGICNCSNCIRKRNLVHLLGPRKDSGRIEAITRVLKRQGREDLTVQDWVDQAIEDKVGAPFDRVRIVCREEDVISPELPPEPVAENKTSKVKRTRSKKSRKKRKDEEMPDDLAMDSEALDTPDGTPARPSERTQRPSKQKRSSPIKGRGSTGGVAQAGQTDPIMLKLRLFSNSLTSAPMSSETRKPRAKEVDSDGDTVGDYSEDELGHRMFGTESSLTPMSRSPTPPRRLAFPPRKSPPPIDMHALPSTLYVLAAGATVDEVAMQPAEVAEGPSFTERKRKKPPPVANIVRAPRHSRSQDSNPLLAQHADSSATQAEHSPIFSDNGYILPPHSHVIVDYESTLLPGNVSGQYTGEPPPYSHSPPRKLQSAIQPNDTES